jgi:5-methyltetrahydrofolate--homocysteine methyltransferase
VPLLVGGAALTSRFTHGKIAAEYEGLCTYASDAMTGLDLVERILDSEKREPLEREVAALRREAQRSGTTAGGARTASPRRDALPRTDLIAPPPPDTERHVEQLDPEEVWRWINPQMLYGKHLGLRGAVERLREAGDAKLAELQGVVRQVQDEAVASGFPVRAVWRFFPARARGESLILLDPATGAQAACWDLPRQAGEGGLCLTDFVLSAGDHVALLVTTAGEAVAERAALWREEGQYLKSHVWAALALESAEAAAELVHARLRAAWGFADPEGWPRRDVFAARYRGKRYSFGYPACPDLAGQRQLFIALAPEQIGVTLTEGDMMDPEASVSALVFQHPEARYFGV